MDDVRHPDIDVQLSGLSSNAMALTCAVVDAIKEAARRGTITREERDESIREFRAEAYSGDYDHLLQTCMKWVNVS